MKLVMLGSGTSTGVPRIGGEDGKADWGLCDPSEPKNRRTRPRSWSRTRLGRAFWSIPDRSAPAIAGQRHPSSGCSVLDHDHADHCHGIDDLRPLRYGRGGPIAGYAVDETMRRLRNRFSYVFSGQHGYHTLVEIEGWTG
jgi:phosphoribosyl 1,2-cyclic phosphate phosphodiesterase